MLRRARSGTREWQGADGMERLVASCNGVTACPPPTVATPSALPPGHLTKPLLKKIVFFAAKLIIP